MSFNQLKVAELREVAESFGVELPEKANAQTIVAELSENGVTFEMWEQHLGRVEEAKNIKLPEVLDAPVVDSDSPKIIIKMNRDNMRYDTHGYTFRKSHPYHAIPTDVAQQIFDTEEGFVIATPREVEEFYS